MTVYAPSKRRRFRNAYRAGEYGPMHLRYGRGKVLAETNRTASMPQVTGLTATAGSLRALLAWTAVPNANQYKVEQSPNGSTGWTQVALTDAGMTSVTIAPLTASVAVFFRVSAINGAGVAGTVSANATCTPTA